MSIADRWFTKRLRCPDCRGDLDVAPSIIACYDCEFERMLSELLDLRPLSPRPAECAMLRVLQSDPADLLKSIDTERPKITYNGPKAERDSQAFMSLIPKFINEQGSILDLGCGPRDQFIPINHLGFKYVGVDYNSRFADLLADAHSIPFKSETFDGVFCYAVLEHLHNPFIAIQEIERVLKKGGIFIGAVSQGEPFHASYFHHTAWGLISLVTSVTSMSIVRMWDSMDTLYSLKRMGRYPRVIRAALGAVAAIHEQAPFLAPRRMSWSKQEKRLDRIYRAGSISFLIQKP